jgi:hypothetical protein
LPGKLDNIGGETPLVATTARDLALRRAMLPERSNRPMDEEVAESNNNLHHAQAPAVLDHSRALPQRGSRSARDPMLSIGAS